jgi:hypothetical protein
VKRGARSSVVLSPLPEPRGIRKEAVRGPQPREEMGRCGQASSRRSRWWRSAGGGRAACRWSKVCRQHGTSEQTYYLYGLPPMGKRPGTARGSVADIYPASWTSRAPMGNPRTCASTAGRPRGPL